MPRRWTVLLCIGVCLLGGRPVIADSIADSTIDKVIVECTPLLIAMQEGDGPAEWPYEGVYRVRGDIPIGYRIGGTAIVATALLYAPGFDVDDQRQDAVRRATEFVVSGSVHRDMQHQNIRARYDVRGWGYTYGLQYLLRLETTQRVPAGMDGDVVEAIRFYIAGIEATAIPETGGWNYSRGAGFDQPCPHASFMTAPTLLALFDAVAQGYDVDADVITKGLNALERSRTPTGAFQYSGSNGARSREPVPGSVGRMLVSEITLHQAGRSSPDRLRGAIDAFLAHWQWLEKRRAQQGTHVAPYGIAPYYFYFAHYYAAMAAELLPEQERTEYRRRVRELIMNVRLDDGTWNDRVFKRSASYGTAMSIMALRMPAIERPATWSLPADAAHHEAGE